MKAPKLKIGTACLLLAFILGTANLFSQVSTRDIFYSKEMVFYGLDFTRTKFVGRTEKGFDVLTEFELVNEYIPAWNRLVAIEPDRFDLKNAFWKNNIYYDLKPVEAKNKEIDPHGGLVDDNPHTITPIQIEAMVSSYPQGDKKEGLGLVFIVENFDKPNVIANYYVTFFDVSTKKILFCERMSGVPIGIGPRNYWAGSLKRVLADIREFKFRHWKNKFT